MVGRNDPLARMALAGDTTPPGVLAHLAAHGTNATKAAVAAHPRLPDEAVAELAAVRAPKVRAAVLSRHGLDPATARRALAGPLTDDVVLAALLCDALTEDDLDRVVDWFNTPRRREARALLGRHATVDDLAGRPPARRLLLTRVALPARAMLQLLDAEPDDTVAGAAVAAQMEPSDHSIGPAALMEELTDAAVPGTGAGWNPAGTRKVERRARLLAPWFRRWLESHPDHRLAPRWARLVGRDAPVLDLPAEDVRGDIGIQRHGTGLTRAVTDRFGDDVAAWQTAAELLAGWDGTVAELLDAAAALRTG